MQTSLMNTDAIETFVNPNAESYREKWGLALPPQNTNVELKYMEGVKWHLHWTDCPDDEGILYGWITKKQTAIDLAAKHKWNLNL